MNASGGTGPGDAPGRATVETAGRAVRVIGLMSGTSADGVDAALLRIHQPADGGAHPRIEIEGVYGRPWPVEFRAAIHRVAGGEAHTDDIARIATELADGFGDAALELLSRVGVSPDDVAAVCCHGQTVWHIPPVGGSRGHTLQLLDAATLAARTGIPCVHDLRSADMAAGGHGAPLVAWPDRILFGDPHRTRAILNLGGMANVTLLTPEGDPSAPFAFDIGPANALIDLAMQEATGGVEAFDPHGEWAARGVVDTALLSELMEHPFFDQDPPRSTGREEFGPALIHRIAERRGLVRGAAGRKWEIVVATLTLFTARSIARAFDRHLLPRGVDEVLVAGGGVLNPTLMAWLADALHPLGVRTVDQAIGLADSAREAAAFALLGWAFLRGLPANVPDSTGAEGPRVLGSWTPAPGRPHPDFLHAGPA